MFKLPPAAMFKDPPTDDVSVAPAVAAVYDVEQFVKFNVPLLDVADPLNPVVTTLLKNAPPVVSPLPLVHHTYGVIVVRIPSGWT